MGLLSSIALSNTPLGSSLMLFIHTLQNSAGVYVAMRTEFGASLKHQRSYLHGQRSSKLTCQLWTPTSQFEGCFTVYESPWANLHVVAMFRFMSDRNQPSLPSPLYSVLVFLVILPTALHFLTLFLRSYLCLINPFNNTSLYESLLQPWCNS